MSNEIVNFCEQEHAIIENKYIDYLRHKSEGREAALMYYRKFKCCLHRHMVMEEDVLFSFFEDKTGLVKIGPTHLMRQEHETIRKMLLDYQHKIDAGEVLTLDQELKLMSLFRNHGLKEDEILHSVADMADPQEQSFILDKLRTPSLGCCARCLSK